MVPFQLTPIYNILFSGDHWLIPFSSKCPITLYQFITLSGCLPEQQLHKCNRIGFTYFKKPTNNETTKILKFLQ